MAQVKVAFKNILDKRATYKRVDKVYLTAAASEYARVHCEDSDLYKAVMHEKVHIHLNRKYVKVDDWATTSLVDGDKILITPVVEGDLLGGGTLGLVLGAILIGVSAIFTGGATLAIAGVLFNQYLFLMGAAMLVGGLASMLMQPDLPTLSGGGFNSSGQSSPTYSWSGITTQANPQTPVPIVYGKHMIGGNLIGIFTERQGADDFLYMLIAMSEGEIAGICTEENTDNVCTTTDRTSASYKHPYITLDDQPFENYSDIEWWYRNGTNMPNAASGQHDPTVQNIIPHFNGSRMQIDDGRPLSKEGVIYTTTKEVDMARIQVLFPAMYNAEGGSVSSSTVTYAVDFRVNGDVDWQSITPSKYAPISTPQTNNRVTAPSQNFNIIYNTSVPGITQGGAFATSEQEPDSIFIECTDSVTVTPGTPDLNNLQDVNVRNSEIITTLRYNVKNLRTNAMWTLTVRKYQPVSWDYRNSHTEPYGFWITSGAFSIEGQRVDLGPYTVSLPTGLSRGDSYIFSSTRTGEYWQTINAKSKTNFWDTTEINFHTASGGVGKAIYDIRVRRQSEMSDSFEVSNNAILNSVIEIINGDFIYPNTALLGMKIKATDQLSGSPPNINLMVKGMKIEVPDHSGVESFEEIFWSEDNNRWEYNGLSRTWDNTTYINEYSNNSMACLKDLMTNKIYGLGEYTNTVDFSDTNTIALMKECHKEYVPTENDYTKWWGAGNTTEFIKNIEDGMGNVWQDTFTINSGVPSVSYGSSYSHWLPFRLDSPLKAGQRYRFSITLSGTSHNVDIDIACQRTDWQTGQSYYYQIGDYTAPEIGDKGDGAHTYDFTAPFMGINLMAINIKKTGQPVNISGTITDISINSIQGTGSNRAWHYHTYNGILDTQQAALTALLEFAHSFRVWPSWYEGTFKFIMDKDEVPIHTISIANTVSFAQTFTPLSEIPYRIVGQFTDEDHKYDMTQIMVQSSDTNVPKSNKQTVGLKGITNRKRAEREIKFKLTKFTNATHSISIKCGMDMIHATAGDIISVSNDLPQWGHGSRVASYNVGSKYIYLTEPYTFLDATPSVHLIKYQDMNNIFQTASIDVTGINDGDSVRRITTQAWPGAPQISGPLAMGVSTSYVKKFRLLSVTRTGEEEIEANAVEHIDTIYGNEPTLVVNQYFETRELVAAFGKPEVPKNVSITQLLPTEGIGWDIYAEHGNMHSQEIIVELSEGSINPIGFQQIGTILAGQTAMRYINNELRPGIDYTIKIYAKNARGISKAIYQTMSLQKLQYNIAPPTGLLIKGSDALAQTWNGLDVTIAWNPIGQDWYRSGMMDFYTLNIYHTSFDPASPGTNLLRTAYPKKTEYKYTYDMNVEDNGSADLIKGTLIFVVRANLVNGYETEKSRPFRVANAAPSQPQNFNSKVSLRTITFNWSPNAETDFKSFRYRTHLKGNVGTPISTWSSWEDTTGNSLARIVNGTEIGTYGQQTRAFAEVKTVDIYNSSSTIASGNNVTEQLGVTLGTQAVASWNIATDAVEAIKVRANAISALKINVATLSAITANMGVLTAGVAKSADGRLLVDFNNKFIKIFDAASTLRVQLGSIP